MLEITTTRHNPLVDPVLAVWSWEIPVYLFVGGIVAGLMVLAGWNLLRLARGDDPRRFFSLQAPILALVLLSAGMGALFLDLAHKLYVWRVYLAFEPTSPMSWGSWILLLVYPVLIASALIRLDETWPWLGARLPAIRRASEALLARPGTLRVLAWINIGVGIGVGVYTGILLSTMVARPLWNSAILGPLFLFSGLSAGAALLHLAATVAPGGRAPAGMIGGALASLVQRLGPEAPEKRTADSIVRADLAFIAIEMGLIFLLVVGLLSAGAAQIEAAQSILHGPYAMLFWGGVIGLGLVVPLALQALELGHKIPHSVVPALLVLGGGLALRWLMVGAGQASGLVQVAGH
jgi:formate-dependent nitrite reductase membrane component NrfD